MHTVEKLKEHWALLFVLRPVVRLEKIRSDRHISSSRHRPIVDFEGPNIPGAECFNQDLKYWIPL